MATVLQFRARPLTARAHTIAEVDRALARVEEAREHYARRAEDREVLPAVRRAARRSFEALQVVWHGLMAKRSRMVPASSDYEAWEEDGLVVVAIRSPSSGACIELSLEDAEHFAYLVLGVVDSARGVQGGDAG